MEVQTKKLFLKYSETSAEAVNGEEEEGRVDSVTGA